MKKTLLIAAAFLLFLPAAVSAQEIKPLPGLAMHGDLKYAADFKNLEYANPDAPKGGEMRLASAGTFDNLNPYIIKGVSAPGLGMTYQTLLSSTSDEAFSEYGQVAASIEIPEDRSWVVFNLRPEAKWHDGKPLTADDVVFSFHTLMEKGHPFYRAYYGHVKEAVAESKTRVKFTFGMADNRELPLIMGQMPVLPKHYWEGKNFESTTLTPPLGSGPYKIKSVDNGRRIVYERVKDWWAKDLPINKGQYNFDTIVYDLYRDETVLQQALFSGAYDFRSENIAKSWMTSYDDKVPVKEGLIRKEEVEHSMPSGMQAFVLNLRRPMFQDPKVRAALNYAFDFEWSNKQLAFGVYKRTDSFFENSELASTGLPEGRELEILEKHRGKIPEEVFTATYKNPETNGTGQDMRANLTTAKKMLSEAGWKINKAGLLEKDGKAMRIEFLLYSDTFSRWISPFIANLKKLGVEASMRVIDTAQYQNRTDNFDFDIIVGSFPQSLSPGNEQRDFWASDKADVPGSRNSAGIKNPVIDELIQLVITAPDRAELIARTRALDRVLLWNHYVIPQWHYNKHRLAYWDKFGKPAVSPKYGTGVPDTWWFDADKAAAIAKKMPAEKK